MPSHEQSPIRYGAIRITTAEVFDAIEAGIDLDLEAGHNLLTSLAQTASPNSDSGVSRQGPSDFGIPQPSKGGYWTLAGLMFAFLAFSTYMAFLKWTFDTGN